MDELYNSFIKDAEKSFINNHSSELLKLIKENNADNKGFFQTIINTLSSDTNNLLEIFEFPRQAFIFITIFIIIYTIGNVFKRSHTYSAVKYILSVILAANLLIPSYEFLNMALTYIKDISILLGILTPTIGILAASGGNVATAKTSGIAFSIFLSGVQILLETIIPIVISLIFCIAVIDTLTDEGKLQAISALVKNTLFGFFSFLSALFLIIVNFGSNISANTDTVSAKALKLLISNAVPIIGGTMGEALKFTGGGIVAVKNSIGTTAVIFIICAFIPVLLIMWGYGLMYNIILIVCDYFGLTEIKKLIIHLKYALDFTLAAISVIVVAALINIGIFTNQLPAVLT